jgi:hypothetical protein
VPVKPIAVPAKSKARRGSRTPAPASVALDHDDHPAAPPRRPARPDPAPLNRQILAQPSHRYRIGERLRLGNGGYSIARAASFCKVTALLPYEGHGSLLYRVRSEIEQFERVVAEGDLSRNLDSSA